MDAKKRLEAIFTHFPGIGPRQARRFVYYLISRTPDVVKELADLIVEVKKLSHECKNCHKYFLGHNQNNLCEICSDPGRDKTKLLIVARDIDLEAIEKTGLYKGYYFVLGGTVPILEDDPDKRIRLGALKDRVLGLNDLAEIIISMNATPEGDNTLKWVKKALLLYNKTQVKISILGRGLSTGAELEYIDENTLSNALSNRHE